MIPLTISLIAFALSAFALILAVVVNRRLVKKNKELTRQLSDCIDGKDSFCREAQAYYKQLDRLRFMCDTTYGCSYIIKTYEDSETVAVCKVKCGEECIIKLFVDPDQDFNRREAEELVEKLNEK